MAAELLVCAWDDPPVDFSLLEVEDAAFLPEALFCPVLFEPLLLLEAAALLEPAFFWDEVLELFEDVLVFFLESLLLLPVFFLPDSSAMDQK